jgi:hypothetical protein
VLERQGSERGAGVTKQIIGDLSRSRQFFPNIYHKGASSFQDGMISSFWHHLSEDVQIMLSGAEEHGKGVRGE